MELLVSVVTADEVGPAVEGGADIIDVKNPREGALGANFPRVIRQVRERTPKHLPVSAAIGDVPDKPGTAALAALGAAGCGVQFVKVGLLGPHDPADAVYLLREVCRAVRGCGPSVCIIGAAYADAHKVGALPPLALPGAAREAGIDGCMLDTAVKGEGTLLDYLDPDQLARFAAECRRGDLLCALAGSLGEDQVASIGELRPDIIGFRSAACDGGRVDGRVSRGKVRRLKSLMT